MKQQGEGSGVREECTPAPTHGGFVFGLGAGDLLEPAGPSGGSRFTASSQSLAVPLASQLEASSDKDYGCTL